MNKHPMKSLLNLLKIPVESSETKQMFKNDKNETQTTNKQKQSNLDSMKKL